MNANVILVSKYGIIKDIISMYVNIISVASILFILKLRFFCFLCTKAIKSEKLCK